MHSISQHWLGEESCSPWTERNNFRTAWHYLAVVSLSNTTGISAEEEKNTALAHFAYLHEMNSRLGCGHFQMLLLAFLLLLLLL